MKLLYRWESECEKKILCTKEHQNKISSKPVIGLQKLKLYNRGGSEKNKEKCRSIGKGDIRMK